MTRRGLLVGLLPLVLAAGCVPGHLVYSTDAYRGTVVDAETKTPLVGAVVLAIWYREAALFGGHGPAEDYHNALEVLTDAKGEFTIPAKTHFTLIGKILEPKFVAYQAGYAFFPSPYASPKGRDLTAAYEQRMFNIELARFKTREEQMRVRDYPVWIPDVPHSKMPSLSTLVNDERKQLGLQAVRLGR